MSWKPEVDQIEQRRALAREMGGADAVEKQHERGRLCIRERIDEIADPGSFHEHGPLAGHAEYADDGTLVDFTPANYVLGFAKIDGRPVVLGGEDFTLRGGSPSPSGLRKSVYSEDLACHYRLPLIRFLEGGGGSVAGAAGNAGREGREKSGRPAPRSVPENPFGEPRFLSIAKVLRTAPVCSAALGAVAGFPAARLAASHFSVMTKESSQVLIGGPDLVARALGEQATKQDLGGAHVHGRSGVVDNVARDEHDALAQIKRFLSYLPTNVSQRAPRCAPEDEPGRCEEALLEIVPRDRRRIYKMRRLLELVVDRGSLFELTAGYGRSQITALARLDGRPVGVLANDPAIYGGSMGADGAQKLRRFVRLCETFHLPILSFVDEPGFMIGRAAEAAATIRHGVEAIVAVVESTVPWISVHVRKAYGVAAAAHFGPHGTVLAWPSAESGALPLEGGVAVAFRREIAAAADPEAKRRELEEQLGRNRSPFPRAELFGVHDLIDPRRTRPALCEWLAWAEPLLEARLPRAPL
jgi:acetyl-CoA carboxylase carboxyltransferase component